MNRRINSAGAKKLTSMTRRKIVSVLAGYAWDMDNPFVRDPKRYLAAVRELVTQPT